MAPFYVDMKEIINGDSRMLISEILEKHKDRNIVIVSDVPFNIGYGYASYKDSLPEDEYLDMLKSVFLHDVPFVIIHYPEALYKIAHSFGVLPERVCSWVYNSNTKRQHRDVAYFGVKPDFKRVAQPYKNLNDKRIVKRMEEGKTCSLYDWWNINQVKNISKEKTAHPCQMPLEVMKNIVGVLPEGSLIIDPFMGSGTTGVAALSLGYDFIGIEIDEGYTAIARERMKEYECKGNTS